MVLLIATLVAGEQDAIVVRKKADRIGAVGGGLGHRHWRASTRRQHIGVINAGRIAAEQHAFFIGAEGGARDVDRRHELLDGVLLWRFAAGCFGGDGFFDRCRRGVYSHHGA